MRHLENRMEQELIYYEELDSTNAEMKRLVEKKMAKEGTTIIAGMQTAGRGRHGRVWHSPSNGSLYMSILVEPSFHVDKVSMLTLVMAFAVATTLLEQGIEVQIKWPNDLVISGKKVCGILTELYHSSEKGMYLIVGVGVNLSKEMLPMELMDLATSICMDREMLAKMLTTKFWEAYQQFQKIQNLTFIKDEYNRMLVNCSRQVRVLDPAGEYSGIAQGIDDEGKLLVQKENGEIVSVFAGEVSVRGIYGYV